MTAKVFKAYDEQLKEPVALKVLNTKCASAFTNRSKDFFDNEVSALEKLKPHENVVRVIQYGKSKMQLTENSIEECQFIALQYIDGVALIDFLSCKGALSEAVACSIFKQIASGLMHIHSSGLVHRDIKSDNIVISSDCKPHLVDFGFASSCKGELENGMFTSRVGTPSYMAPEML